MAERFPEVTTIQGAINSGAARLVSSFSQGFLGEFKHLPPWQKVENYIKVVFPSLNSRQRARVREYGMAAAASGRAFERAAGGSRAFESVAPNYRTTGNRSKVYVQVPVVLTYIKTKERVRIGYERITLYRDRNATKQDIIYEVNRRLGNPNKYLYRDPYGRVLAGFRDASYGDPVVASIEKVN